MPLNRRHFLFGALAAPVLAATKKHAVAERPNIVLIVAEDLGAYMLGCYANSEVHTPNIDRLGRTGGRVFKNFFLFPLWAGHRALAPLRAITVTEVALQRRLASFWTRRLPRSRFSWRSPGPVRTPWRRRRR